MRRAGIFKSSMLVDFVNYVGLPLLVVYTFSMFLYPWFAGKGNWEYVQDVWDRWQSLNTGALAFLASLIAFNISRYNENRQREREFVAARAFLPSTLSGLTEYLSQCASIYGTLWESNGTAFKAIQHPTLPVDYREVFSNCVRHANPSVGSYLSNILAQLQIHEARLREIVAKSITDPSHVVDKYDLLVYMFRVGELYALVGRVFGFARGQEPFEDRALDWESFRNAYSVLGLEADDIFISDTMNLQAFTKRRIDRANEQVNEYNG